jgi:hypothetical protein
MRATIKEINKRSTTKYFLNILGSMGDIKFLFGSNIGKYLVPYSQSSDCLENSGYWNFETFKNAFFNISSTISGPIFPRVLAHQPKSLTIRNSNFPGYILPPNLIAISYSIQSYPQVNQASCELVRKSRKYSKLWKVKAHQTLASTALLRIYSGYLFPSKLYLILQPNAFITHHQELPILKVTFQHSSSYSAYYHIFSGWNILLDINYLSVNLIKIPPLPLHFRHNQQEYSDLVVVICSERKVKVTILIKVQIENNNCLDNHNYAVSFIIFKFLYRIKLRGNACKNFFVIIMASKSKQNKNNAPTLVQIQLTMASAPYIPPSNRLPGLRNTTLAKENASNQLKSNYSVFSHLFHVIQKYIDLSVNCLANFKDEFSNEVKDITDTNSCSIDIIRFGAIEPFPTYSISIINLQRNACKNFSITDAMPPNQLGIDSAFLNMFSANKQQEPVKEPVPPAPPYDPDGNGGSRKRQIAEVVTSVTNQNDTTTSISSQINPWNTNKLGTSSTAITEGKSSSANDSSINLGGESGDGNKEDDV